MAQWHAVFLGLIALLGVAAPGPGAEAADRWAGLAETIFQNFNRDLGLPHPVPTALAEDNDGFLWVGTQGGLGRWDGYRFHGYKPDPNLPGHLPDGWVQVLHLDPRGRLWVGTSVGGLVRYDAENDQFLKIPLSPGKPDHAHIGAIADDGVGGLWVGADGNLNHLDPGTGTVLTLRHDGQDPGSIPDGLIQALLRDSKGRLWVGTTKGLARRDDGAGRFKPVPLTPLLDETQSVSALFEDATGRIWIGTTRHGVYSLAPGGGEPRAFETGGTSGSTLQHDWISAISAAGPNEIWLATRGDGIVAIDAATRQARRMRHDRTLPDSLAHDDIWTLLRDNAGSMWAGGTGGLSYHPRDLGVISTVFGASDRPDGVSGADIYSILPTKDGRIWLGFIGGGVDIVDPMGARVAQLGPDATRPDSALPKDVVTSLAEGAGGNVYVGTLRGLYQVDGASHDVTLAAMSQRDPRAPVGALLADAGVLWVGGQNDGLWGVKIGDTAAVPVFGPAESSRLTSQRVRSIRRGLGQDLWIGTVGGLNRLDLATHEIEPISPDPADPSALPMGFVSSLLIDRQGRLWVGTFGGGIAIMVGRRPDGRPLFHRLGIADGVPHLNIDMLLLDDQGTVWASTDDGLARIDPTSFAIRPVKRAEGSSFVDYFENAGAVDQAGEALFGAKGGMTVIRPAPLANWTFHPPVVVSDVQVGGRSVPSGRFNHAGAADPVVLTPETNSLAVEFAALDFTAPGRNRYAYRLDGFDRDWIETDPTRRLAAYTNLPPGSYVLHLRGSNRDGVWAERELAIPISVLPAWYQTLWFKLAATLAVLAIIVVIIRSRTAYLRRRQGELERQIAERTADLRAANSQLFELATKDVLTGCLNRRHFTERACELMALANRYETPLSLAIIDLDNFKAVNDTYGHPAGDAVLRTVGRTSLGHVRATDLLGRMGGEEFALLMPNTTVAGAAQLANRLREAIKAAETRTDGTSIVITASVGLAEMRRDEPFDQIYARADAALYAAKGSGRNRVTIVTAH
jgi:diguanylate cyclase (GGDEF)-like protein